MEIQPYEDDVFYDPLGMRLWEKRHSAVSAILEKNGIRKVLDIACAEGKFLKRLTMDLSYTLLAGVDLDPDRIDEARKNLEPELYHYSRARERTEELEVRLYAQNVFHLNSELKDAGYEAITMIEFIEHIEVEKLDHLTEIVFGYLGPDLIIVTTPNKEFNVHFNLPSSESFRHFDHKFEFTRREFQTWAHDVAAHFGYNVEITGVGSCKTGDSSFGFCSQIAAFRQIVSKKLPAHAESEFPAGIIKGIVIKYPFDKEELNMRQFFAQILELWRKWKKDLASQQKETMEKPKIKIEAFLGNSKISDFCEGKEQNFLKLLLKLRKWKQERVYKLHKRSKTITILDEEQNY